MIPTEIELKLAARPEDLDKLKEALRRLSDGAGAVRNDLVATYYDTPDEALRRNGLVLRVRRGGGTFVQTVKSAPIEGGDALARGEWEDVVSGPRPDPAAPRSGQWLTPTIVDQLRPVFRTEVTRTAFDLAPSSGTLIEAVIDTGWVRAQDSDAVAAICEIELESKAGASTALYDAALHLMDVAPLRVEIHSKAERGYRLHRGGPDTPEAVRAEAPPLDFGMSAEAVLQRIGCAGIAHLLRNEAAAVAGHPDGVHQMRVAMRRLRAGISAFGKMLPAADRAWVSRELKWLADVLATARNLDVFASTLLPRSEQGKGRDAAMQPLAGAADRRRRAAYKDAIAAIQSPRYTIAVLRLMRWFDSGGWREGEPGSRAKDMLAPIAAVAPRLLDRRLRAVRRHAKHFADQSPERRHELRIAVKKLRYVIELLTGAVAPAPAAAFRKHMKRLQDDLGYANDVRVGHELVESIRDAESGPPLAAAGEQMLSWHDDRLKKHEPALREHLRRLLHAEPFWHEGAADAAADREDGPETRSSS